MQRLLSMIILFGLIAAIATPAQAVDQGKKIAAPHLVIDSATGEVLASHREFVRWAPASLTKMMTAYTVFRAIEPDFLAMNSPVRVTEEALSEPPSKMGYPIGTILTVENALKILMVKSANDISVALAQAVGGSEAQFVALMNANARRLGMTDTRFSNPHGLHEPDQFTTARDMALLTMALGREFPQYAEFFDIVYLRVTGRRLRNHNALLREFPGTNGMKTGYVCASGYNVVVRTKRDDRELIAVVFGGKSGLERNVRTAELLTGAFAKDANDKGKLVAELARPEDASAIPIDITRTTCPRKYAATVKPKRRPANAPKPQEFDAIDTQVSESMKIAVQEAKPILPIPLRRPQIASAGSLATGAATDASSGTDGLPDDPPVVEAAPETAPQLTLKERASLVFEPRTDLRKDVKISLNGATGPNPFAIKHTNGGRYVAPIPVPTPKPALDSEATQE